MLGNTKGSCSYQGHGRGGRLEAVRATEGVGDGDKPANDGDKGQLGLLATCAEVPAEGGRGRIAPERSYGGHVPDTRSVHFSRTFVGQLGRGATTSPYLAV